MDDAELARMQARIHSLRQRLIDTAKYLNGIAAVVEGMNRGATDGLLVAVHAVEAVAEDLGGVHAGLSCETRSIGLHNSDIAKEHLPGAPGIQAGIDIITCLQLAPPTFGSQVSPR